MLFAEYKSWAVNSLPLTLVIRSDEFLRPKHARAQRHALGKYSQLQEMETDESGITTLTTKLVTPPLARSSLRKRPKRVKDKPNAIESSESDPEPETEEGIVLGGETHDSDAPNEYIDPWAGIALINQGSRTPSTEGANALGEHDRANSTTAADTPSDSLQRLTVTRWTLKRDVIPFDRYCCEYRRAWEKLAKVEDPEEGINRHMHDYQSAWQALQSPTEPCILNPTLICDDSVSGEASEDELVDYNAANKNDKYGELGDPPSINDTNLPGIRNNYSAEHPSTTRSQDRSCNIGALDRLDSGNMDELRSSPQLPATLDENHTVVHAGPKSSPASYHSTRDENTRRSPLSVASESLLNASDPEPWDGFSCALQSKQESQADSQVNPFSTASVPLLQTRGDISSIAKTIDPRHLSLAPSSDLDEAFLALGDTNIDYHISVYEDDHNTPSISRARYARTSPGSEETRSAIAACPHGHTNRSIGPGSVGTAAVNEVVQRPTPAECRWTAVNVRK